MGKKLIIREASQIQYHMKRGTRAPSNPCRTSPSEFNIDVMFCPVAQMGTRKEPSLRTPETKDGLYPKRIFAYGTVGARIK